MQHDAASFVPRSINDEWNKLKNKSPLSALIAVGLGKTKFLQYFGECV